MKSSYFKNLLHRFKPKKLLDTVALWVLILFTFQLSAIGFLFSEMLYDVIEGQTEKRALQSARYIALIPELRADPAPHEVSNNLTTLMESIRLEEKITRIVISDENGSPRLSFGLPAPSPIKTMVQ